MQSSQTVPRRRTFLACNTCKSKKVRCDGGRPKCGRCAKPGVECIYTSNTRDKRLAQRNRWMARQKLRYREFPNSIRGHDNSEPQDHSLSEPAGDAVPVTLESPDDSTPIASLEPRIATKPREYASSNSQLKESLADVLATNAFDQMSSGQVGYFGSSTNHGFFWCLSAAITNLGHRESRIRSQNTNNDRMAESGNKPAGRKFQSCNPRSNQQYPLNEELVARFFDTVGDILPFVEEQPVAARLDVLHESSTTPDASTQSWRALLNIIIAYALYTLDGPSPEPYYRQATSILYGAGIHLSTLQTLQALVLLSSFEQNIRRSMASLSSHSLAVRTAYHLGLHAPATYAHLGAAERKLRARLWLAITTQDRVLSACLGRPCLVASSHIRPEILAIVSAENVIGLESRDYSSLSAIYFSQFVSLHQITGLGLDTIYLSNISSVRDLSLQQLLSEVLNASLQLDKWRNNSHFRILGASNPIDLAAAPSADAEKYDYMISLHYHRVCLLIHGAVVMRSLECVSTTGLDCLSGVAGDTILSLLRRDLKAARDTHHVISYILQDKSGFLERTALWWICNYSAFTVSLHLLGLWMLSGHMSFGQVDGLGPTTLDIEQLLQGALRNLKYMGKTSLLSSKAHTRLRSLFDLLRDRENTCSTLSPQDFRDGIGDVFSATPQGSSWVGMQPDAVSTSSDYTFPCLGEFEPDSLLGFLVTQDTMGFDYDFGSIIGGPVDT